jgi:hypothetical protein
MKERLFYFCDPLGNPKVIFYDFLVEKDAAEDGVDYDDEGKEKSADHHNSNLLLFAWFHSCDEVKEFVIGG